MGGKCDLSGRLFGTYRVEKEMDIRLNGSVVWLLRCKCGDTVEVSQKRLAAGHVPICAQCDVPLDDYGLGIIWATATISGKRLLVRNEDRHFADYLAIQNGGKVFQLHHSRNDTVMYCLKLTRRIQKYALSYGFAGRSDADRIFPSVQDPFSFARAIIQCHSSLDYAIKINRRGTSYPALRLRIFGALRVIEGINRVLHDYVGTGLKTPQLWHGIYTLYYQASSEVYNICAAVVQSEPYSLRFSALFNRVIQQSGYHP